MTNGGSFRAELRWAHGVRASFVVIGAARSWMERVSRHKGLVRIRRLFELRIETITVITVRELESTIIIRVIRLFKVDINIRVTRIVTDDLISLTDRYRMRRGIVEKITIIVTVCSCGYSILDVSGSGFTCWQGVERGEIRVCGQKGYTSRS